jgi:Ca2+-binding EF-hand superfamily protein
VLAFLCVAQVTVAEVEVTEAEAKEVFGLLDVLSMGSISKEELFGALSPPEPVPPAAVAASAPAPASHDLAALEKKAREAAEGLDQELDALSSKVEKAQRDDKEEAAKTGGAIADAAGAGAENKARAGEGGKKESADAATSSSQQHGAASGPSEKKSEGSSSSAAGVGVGVGGSAAGAAGDVAGKDEGRSGQGGAGSTSGDAGGESAPVVQVAKSLDAIKAALVGKGEGLLQALKALDSNNDGKISSREFCRAVVKMPSVELMQADAALLYASLVTAAKDGGEGTLTIAEVEAVLVDPDTAAKLPGEIKTEPVKQQAQAGAAPPGGGAESGGGLAGGVDAALSSEGVSHGRSIQAIRNMLKQRGAAVLAQLRDADSGKAGDSLTLGEFRGALQQLGSEVSFSGIRRAQLANK